MPGHSNNLCVSSWGWRTARTPVSDLSSLRGPLKELRSIPRYLVPGGTSVSSLTPPPPQRQGRNTGSNPPSTPPLGVGWEPGIGNGQLLSDQCYSVQYLAVSRSYIASALYTPTHQPTNHPLYRPLPPTTYHLPPYLPTFTQLSNDRIRKTVRSARALPQSGSPPLCFCRRRLLLSPLSPLLRPLSHTPLPSPPRRLLSLTH